MTPAIAATLAAALLAVVVTLKRAEKKAERFVDDSHIPLHQEDR